MRTADSLRLLATALLLVALPGWAKEKPQPAPQWALDAAKVPTPALAQDSAAVILSDDYLITVDTQNHAVEREREAIRILKPQGRGYTHCAVSYDTDERLNLFHSWTIAADGRQFQAMDADFTDRGAYDNQDLQFTERIRRVTPPGSDPGSVVVCETEVQLRPYMHEEEWQIQSSIPFVSESLELALPPGGQFAQSWRRYAPVQPTETGPNHLRWEIHNMPALDLENMHAIPAWSALAARMSVKWGDAAVQGPDAQWRALGQWEQQLEEHRTDPTPEVAAKARELTAGAPDLYTRLARITTYIQKNIRYFLIDKGIGGWQAHYAGDIFRNGYGDCKDKTTLLIAMLRAIDVPAYYFHVDSRRGVIDPDAPSLIGNHMITAIELPVGESDPRLLARVKTPEGKNLLIFDPTDEVTPIGLIRAELQGAWGNISDGSASRVLHMPVLPPESEGLERTGSFTLAADGSISGNLLEQFTGDDATTERWFLKGNDSRGVHDRLAEGLDRELPGVAFQDFEFSHQSDLDHPLALSMHLTAPAYARPTGPLLLLRPRVIGSHNHFVPDVMEGKDRPWPIELGHPGRWRDSFDIALPSGYAVDELPDPIILDVGFASYHASVSARNDDSGASLHYETEYVQRDVEIPPAKAPDLRRLLSAILTAENASAVLKKQ